MKTRVRTTKKPTHTQKHSLASSTKRGTGHILLDVREEIKTLGAGFEPGELERLLQEVKEGRKDK